MRERGDEDRIDDRTETHDWREENNRFSRRPAEEEVDEERKGVGKSQSLKFSSSVLLISS